MHVQRQVVPTGALLRPRYAHIPSPLPGAISCSHFPKSTWRGAGGWASPGAVLAGRILSGIALGSVAELSLPAGCTHEVQKCTRIKIPTQFTSSGEFSPSFFPFPSPPHSHAQECCCPSLIFGVFHQGKAPSAEGLCCPLPWHAGSAEGLCCPLLWPQGSVPTLLLWSTPTSSTGTSSSLGPR